MTNQTMKHRGHRPINMTGNSENFIKLLLAIGLLVLGTLAVINLREQQLTVTTDAPKSLSAIPQDGRAYFTEPYWNLAEADTVPAKENLNILLLGGRAYYTGPYWYKVGEWVASKSEAPKSLSALPQDGRAYFTEPYWEMGEVRRVPASEDPGAVPLDGWSYYTEPYWKMAAELDSVTSMPKSLSAIPQDGRAYYTEPYWNAIK